MDLRIGSEDSESDDDDDDDFELEEALSLLAIVSERHVIYCGIQTILVTVARR